LYNSQTTDTEDSFEELTKSMAIPKLDYAERDALEGPLTSEECEKSLETFLSSLILISSLFVLRFTFMIKGAFSS